MLRNALLLYLATMGVFFLVDAVMLSVYMTPFFKAEIGHLMATPIRLGPAALFYLGYVAAIVYLASWSELRTGRAATAALKGAVLGGAAYGTYEVTNYALLADWTARMMITDTIWGIVLTGFSAWAGLMITRRFV